MKTETTDITPPDKHELCHGNPDLAEAYDHLTFQWLGTDEFMRRFSHLFTDRVRHENTSAVTAALRSGLAAYSQAKERDDKHYYPHERLKKFLTGCIAEASRRCRCQVVDKHSRETWSVFHEMPLSQWQANRPELDIRELPAEPEHPHFESRLYQQVVPDNMKLAMRRFEHEDDIVAGDLGGYY